MTPKPMVRLSRQVVLPLLLFLAALFPLVASAGDTATQAQQPSSRFYGPVLPQDTLTGIALQMVEQYPDFTLHQLMAGLYRANPDAFRDGDTQHLIPGSVLKWPGPKRLHSISVESARQLFQVQAEKTGRAPEQVKAAAGSAAGEGWPLWLRWLLTNLLAIIAFAGISYLWQRRISRQPEDYAALDEETLLGEIAGEKIPYLPKEFPGKEKAEKESGQSKKPAGAADAEPSETDMEIQLDIAVAYIEIGRLRQARSTLAQVLEAGELKFFNYEKHPSKRRNFLR